jgi:hypothetical protein
MLAFGGLKFGVLNRFRAVSIRLSLSFSWSEKTFVAHLDGCTGDGGSRRVADYADDSSEVGLREGGSSGHGKQNYASICWHE